MSDVVVLTGGVGGAKLVLGLATLLGEGAVTAIVNTGDDMVHMGLHVSPDIDTLLYTLSGRSDEVKGWGRADETWTFLDAVRSLGGPEWFALGDGDLALHVLRTARLQDGEPLSAVTARFAAAWSIGTRLIPMSDDPMATVIDTDEGALAFQSYFVARRCEPQVRAIRFEGASTATPAPGVVEAIVAARVIVVAPSNPWLSVDPILAVPGIREALRTAAAPVVAVSPVRGGEAFKGPTAKIMGELGLGVDVAAIADHYGDWVDGWVIDSDDPAALPGYAVERTDIAMPSLERKVALAQAVMTLAERG